MVLLALYSRHKRSGCITMTEVAVSRSYVGCPKPSRKSLSYTKKVKRKRIIKIISAYALLLLGSAIFLTPFIWMLSCSFKPVEEIYSGSLSIIPQNGTIENYKYIFTHLNENNIFLGFLNTLIIVVPSTIVGTLVAALAAFAFAKIDFPARNIIFFTLISSMAIPGIVTMIPMLKIFNTIGWNNTWLPLMIPGMFGGAGAIFFTRQYMKNIPHELEEAARVDGYSWMGIFWKIELPLAKPIIFSNLLFGFLAGYNDYVGPTLYLSQVDNSSWTLQQVLQKLAMNAGGGTDPARMMAGSVLALIPTLIIFLVFQRFFFQGVSVNGGKDV